MITRAPATRVAWRVHTTHDGVEGGAEAGIQAECRPTHQVETPEDVGLDDRVKAVAVVADRLDVLWSVSGGGSTRRRGLPQTLHAAGHLPRQVDRDDRAGGEVATTWVEAWLWLWWSMARESGHEELTLAGMM